jgi:hypothetical protein
MHRGGGGTVDNVVVGADTPPRPSTSRLRGPAADRPVSATVTDSGHGWPLYATVGGSAAPTASRRCTRTLSTGHYEGDPLPETDYTFQGSTPIAGTYVQETTRGPTRERRRRGRRLRPIVVDAIGCAAPGLPTTAGRPASNETLPGTAKAGRMAQTSTTSPSGGQGTWRFDDPARSGQPDGSGRATIVRPSPATSWAPTSRSIKPSSGPTDRPTSAPWPRHRVYFRTGLLEIDGKRRGAWARRSLTSIFSIERRSTWGQPSGTRTESDAAHARDGPDPDGGPNHATSGSGSTTTTPRLHEWWLAGPTYGDRR